jgi:glucosamine-6-phosphate deaminase
MMQMPDLFAIAATQLEAVSPVPVLLLPDAGALHLHFARSIADEISGNNAAGKPTRLILPVGPVGQYPLLVEMCNRQRISWRDCEIFFMDEYCDWQGRWIDASHPLSFRGFARRALFDLLDAELALPPPQLHFPDPLHFDSLSEAIAAAGGIDTCYGGIGLHGHVAFNEAPHSRFHEVGVEEFRASRTRLLPLASETVVMNGTRGAGGHLQALPPMAVTIGMADIYAARRIRLYCQGGRWQQAILRIALFGSPRAAAASGEDVHYPVTLLRTHADFAVRADAATAEAPTLNLE